MVATIAILLSITNGIEVDIDLPIKHKHKTNNYKGSAIDEHWSFHTSIHTCVVEGQSNRHFLSNITLVITCLVSIDLFLFSETFCYFIPIPTSVLIMCLHIIFI